VAVDTRGDLFVACFVSGQVVEIPSGGRSHITFSPGTGPVSVATDVVGDVYMAGSFGISKVAAGGGVPTTFATGFTHPSGLAVDTAGNVTVTDEAANSVTRIQPNGTKVNLNYTVSGPLGAAIDGAGDLFVADTSNNRVVEGALGSPNETVLASGLSAPTGVGVYAPAPAFSASSPGLLGAVGTPYSYGYKAASRAGEAKPTFRVVSGTLPPGLKLGAAGTLSRTPKSAGSYTFSVAAVNAATAAIATSTVVVLGVGDVVANDNATGHVLDVPAGGGAPLPLAFSGLSGPGSVTVDVHGDVFVTDGGNVVELPATGAAQQTVASGLTAPEGIGTDAKGDVFVDNTGVGQVEDIPAGGSGATLVASGFTDPTGVAADLAGDHYVADDGGSTVYEVPAGGTGPGTPVGGGFSSPSDVAVSPTGTVFVTDQAQGGVAVVTPGKLQSVRGSGLNNPYAVALDPTGNLVVADYGSARLALITPAGTTSTLAGGLQPTGVGVYAPPPVFSASSAGPLAAVGNPYSYAFTATSRAGEGKVTFRVASGTLPPGLKLSAAGGLSGTPTASGSYTFAVAAVNAATAAVAMSTVDVLGVGEVVAVDHATERVVAVPAGGGTPVPLAFSALSTPGGVTVDAHGDVFVTDGGSVIELPASGAAQQTVASGLSGPEGIGTDAHGDVFVNNTGVGQVDEIPAGGTGATLVASGFSDPTGVATDLAGDLFVADDGGGTVYEVPAGGAGPGTPVGSGFISPSNVAVDPTGTLYVTDQAQGGVVVVPPGKPQRVRGSGLNNPYALALDPTGDLVVADYGNSRLALITTAGTTSALASGLAPTCVAVYAPPPVFTTSGVVPAGTAGTAYTYTYTATVVAGEPKAKFGVASGTLPPGLKLAATGTLSGTPTGSGIYTFTVKAYNGASGTLDVPTTITVN
jgi:sugar lactone lactonase YvrE